MNNEFKDKNMSFIKKFIIFIAIFWFAESIFTFPKIISSTPEEDRFAMIILLILSILVPLIVIILEYKLQLSIFSTYPEHQKRPRSEIERIMAIIVTILCVPIVIAILTICFLLK